MPLRAGRNRAFARRRRGYPEGVALEALHRMTAITAGEPAADLGHGLMLPPRYELRREQLERRLTPISNPRRPA